MKPSIEHAIVAIALLTCACSSSTGGDVASNDAGKQDDSAIPKLAEITATIRYGGKRSGQLAVAVFTENPPKSRPPVAFDTSEHPSFPVTSMLRDLDPGHYWVIAVLDLPPFTPGAVKPGPEDRVVTSDAIDLASGEDRAVELVIVDADADAGAD